MPRPTSKTQLLAQTRDTYDALQAELDKLSPAQMDDTGIVGDWSVKDVLAHLTTWLEMCLDWYQTGKGGDTPVTPSEHYTWREIPALNQHIYEMHHARPLDDVIREFHAAHEHMLVAIAQMTDKELFTPKVYAWTKSTTLGSYITSATCSHYAWARKEIRRGLRAKAKAVQDAG
ncbi:MAG: ClbS/DfsB family four-helix bundle protein [Anaerolineae bacterium]|nr:ClbS/DfsB family four-helix bundle protein [Anaerolineae bacterium]